jgi:hypothetical protein
MKKTTNCGRSVTWFNEPCCSDLHSDFATYLQISIILLPIFFFIYSLIVFIFSFKIKFDEFFIFTIVLPIILPWAYHVLRRLLEKI